MSIDLLCKSIDWFLYEWKLVDNGSILSYVTIINSCVIEFRFIYYEEKNVSKGTRVVVKLVSFSQFALKTKMIVPSSGQFENVCF